MVRSSGAEGFYKKGVLKDLAIQMWVIYNVKHRNAIPLKFGDKLLISLTKLMVKAKPVSALQSKKIYFYIVIKFSAFVVIVII